MNNHSIKKAVDYLNAGKIIAYPTESCYGLGCDPFNEKAVQELLKIKNRMVKKGFILVAFSFDQFNDLVQQVPEEALSAVSRTWPGPISWVFPATDKAPKYITGDHDSIAIRISAHPVVQKLCVAFGKPIVSTSANIEGFAPIRNKEKVQTVFKDKIAMIVPGTIGKKKCSSEIRDVLTGAIMRPCIIPQEDRPKKSDQS